MAAETIDSLDTKITALATTVRRIEVSEAARGQLRGMYLYCSSEVRMQRAASPVADGGVAPTNDYAIVPASTAYPVPIPPGQGTYIVTVWVTSGTPNLHIDPQPVSR